MPRDRRSVNVAGLAVGGMEAKEKGGRVGKMVVWESGGGEEKRGLGMACHRYSKSKVHG